MSPLATLATPTGIGFKPITTATPEQVTGEVINGSTESATVHLAQAVATSQDTSLSAEVGADADFSVLGIVNVDASVSVDTSHTFGTTITDTGSTGIILSPAGTDTSSGWITRKTQDASVTGDFDFTTAGGWIVYHVKNVTVTEQAIQDPHNVVKYPFVYGQHWTTATPVVPGN